jgi:hypothetical protein
MVYRVCFILFEEQLTTFQRPRLLKSYVCVQNICTSNSDEKFLCLWMNSSTSNRWFRVSEKKVLKRMFGSIEFWGKKEDWEKCTARRSVNFNLKTIIKMLTRRRMRLEWNVARMRKLKKYVENYKRTLELKRPLVRGGRYLS